MRLGREEPDGSLSTAKHWVDVYSQLTRFAARMGRDHVDDPVVAARIATRRREFEERLRYWQRELSQMLEEVRPRAG